jgi:hypothetical protein
VLLLLLGTCGTAAAQVVTLRPSPGPELTQGPQLAGERVVWSQQLCLKGCDIDSPSETEAVYSIRAADGDGRVRRLFRARTSGAFSGPNFRFDLVSFLASEEALVTLHVTLSGDELEGESGRIAVRAGAPGTRRALLVNCSAPFFTGAAPGALDGSRLAYDPDPCDDFPRLVVRDLVCVQVTPYRLDGRTGPLLYRFGRWTLPAAGGDGARHHGVGAGADLAGLLDGPSRSVTAPAARREAGRPPCAADLRYIRTRVRSGGRDQA